MNRRSGIIGVALTLALVAPSAASARNHDHGDHHNGHRHDHGNGAAVGAAIGLAIVGIAAVAAKNRRDKEQAYRDDDWGSTYSPAGDVTCYRQERQCYWRNRMSLEWTDREFGYDPYRRGY